MPIFELAPVQPHHKDWNSSWHEASCRVHAPDEDRAREWAGEQFSTAAERRSAHDDTVLSPWLNPERSTCQQTADPPPEDYREGQIEVYQAGDGLPVGTTAIDRLRTTGAVGRRWIIVSEGKPPLPVVAGTASSMLPPLQQHAEGRGVNEGNRGEQTLPRIQSNAGQRGGVAADAILVEPGPGHPTVTSEPTKVTQATTFGATTFDAGTGAGDPSRVFREKLTEAPEGVAQSVKFVVEQAQYYLQVLKNQRANTPEAHEAISGLETIIGSLVELETSVEGSAPPDQSVAKLLETLSLILEGLQKLLKSPGVSRTAFACLAVSACAAFDVTGIAQVVIAVSAVRPDKKIIDAMERIIKAAGGGKLDS